MSDLECAKRVIRTEIEGLKALEASFGQEITDAVNAIDEMRSGATGRLIVAGIGKSGHIARKIAATLASTGTPAYFVHPGEASHGDLGMVTENDVVLMLSNSGENQELSDLIHYTRRYGITLIGMTGNPESTLAKHSDIVLCLPKADEACPNVLAPTTSTTMMLALGDALGVALIERMDLTQEQFKVFHPGGKLGQQLQRVEDLMIAFDDMALVQSDAKMDEVILVLSAKNQGCVVVSDEQGSVLGIVTDGDLKRHMSPDLLSRNVSDVMTSDPIIVSQDKLAGQAVNEMTGQADRYLTSLLVADQSKRIVGLIRLQDCLQAGVS